MANNARIPDIETLLQAGIDPKTGLPLKFGNKRCTTKEDIKKLIRKNDEQIFVNKYVWYNLPCNLSSQELERMLLENQKNKFNNDKVTTISHIESKETNSVECREEFNSNFTPHYRDHFENINC